MGMSIASSKDTDEFTYLRYAVLLRKGGERDPAQAAYEKALAISPDDEKRSWMQEEWNQFAIANKKQIFELPGPLYNIWLLFSLL